MSDAVNNDMILGEMRGQLREMVHGMNNISSKVDALSREVIGLGPLAVEIASIRREVDELKSERHRRDGAQGVIAAIVKSPAAAWFVSLAVGLYAVLTGRVQV